MILPTDERCVRIIEILANETDPSDLTEWEYNFVTDNKGRSTFSTKQKEVIFRLTEKYDCD